eukprot:4683505-Pyramimonas_sp.AAC.1
MLGRCFPPPVRVPRRGAVSRQEQMARGGARPPAILVADGRRETGPAAIPPGAREKLWRGVARG